MANTYTPVYNLAKPAQGDLAWDDEINNNMDIIDSALRTISTALETKVPKSTTADLTYYVNPSTGSDENDGSQEHPFATINKALGLIPQVVNHEVEIIITHETYAESINLTGFSGKGSITIDGDNSDVVDIRIENNTLPIELKSFNLTGTDEAVIASNNPGYIYLFGIECTSSAGYKDGFSINNCPAVFLGDCIISNHFCGIYSNLSVVHSYYNNGSSNTYGLYAGNGIIYKLDYQPSGYQSNEITLYGGQILSSRLAERDEDAVAGNLAEFDADGNPVDSGISPSNLLQGFSLVQNGSFEIVDSFSVPWCWEKIHADVTVTTDTGVKDGYGGSTAVKITSAGSNKEGIKYTFRHLKPSTTYSIRIWMKATAGDTAACWTTGGSDNVNLTSTSTTGEYLTDTFTTDSTPTNVVLCIGSTTNTDIVWFDALTVIEGPTPPDKYLPSPQPTVFEFQDFYLVGTTLPGLETLTGSNITKKYVYALDDTEATAITEPLGFNFSMPPNFDPSGSIMLECVGWAKTAAASKNIEYTYYYSPKKYGEDWDTAYSNIVSGDLALYSTQDYRDNLRFQLSINMEAYDVVESKIARTAPSANNLSGDYYFEKLRIWIPRV